MMIYIKVSGIPSGNKLIKTIRYPVKISMISLISSLSLKVHTTRVISLFKNTLSLGAFQSRVKWRFSFCDIFFLFQRYPSFPIMQI